MEWLFIASHMYNVQWTAHENVQNVFGIALIVWISQNRMLILGYPKTLFHGFYILNKFLRNFNARLLLLLRLCEHMWAGFSCEPSSSFCKYHMSMSDYISIPYSILSWSRLHTLAHGIEYISYGKCLNNFPLNTF